MTVAIRRVSVGAVTLEIAEAGVGGSPLLLVHGFSGAKEDFEDFLEPLAEQGWHVVAPDLRGHGASDHPTDAQAYGFDLFQSDVLALVDDLGWDHFVLLGHSMGGMISQAIAIDDPDRLDGLVLMDTIPGPVGTSRGLLFVMRAAGRVFGMKTMARMVRKPPPRSPESVRRLYAERPGFGEAAQAKILATSPVMARVMMRVLSDRPSRIPELRSLDLPVLIIAGEYDMPGFVAGSEAMADAIPNARLVVLAEAAHSPQLETPDTWWAALSSFLDTLPVAPVPGRESTSPSPEAEGNS